MTLLHAVILAAGRGKRMNSDLPKVLHPTGGRPMLGFAVASAGGLRPAQTVIVVPEEHAAIRAAAEKYAMKGQNLAFAVQKNPRGTGDALRCALSQGAIPKNGVVTVQNGDMPLVTTGTLKSLLREHARKKAAMTILTARKSDPSGFGRILRDAKGEISGNVEERDATPAQKRGNEVNVAVYAFDAAFLHRFLGRLKAANKQKEYYLPDLIALALKNGLRVACVALESETEALGANSFAELSVVNEAYYALRRAGLRANGVFVLGESVCVDADARVEPGASLHGPCYVHGSSVIETGTVCETGCVIKSSKVGPGARVKAHCYLDGADVGPRCQIGPFAHLRPGSVLEEDCRVGNFVETKKTVLGKGTKANHLSYIGDAVVGSAVNIGAGTITCNYNGVAKLPTIIGNGVFIGSDTQLVAPVRLGEGCYVGAGTTVTRDVAPGALVVSRVPQKEIPNWVEKRRLSVRRD